MTMTTGFSIFVIIGTIGTLIGCLWLLFANRRTSGEETTGHVHDGIEELDNPLPMWWVWMFVLSVVFAAGYLVYYPGLGNFSGVADWSSANEVTQAENAHRERFAPFYARLAQLDEAELHADRQAQQVGRRLFINHCSTCHGVTARGAFGFPDLTDDAWIWGEGFDNVKTAITRGRSGVMPAWGNALGDQGVREVAHYVRALAGHEQDIAGNATPDAAGAAQFRTFCVACHGPDGSGNPALGAPDLTNDVWLYGGSVDQIAQTLRYGRNGNMPGFAELLSADQIHILAGYVTSLTRDAPATAAAAR